MSKINDLKNLKNKTEITPATSSKGDNSKKDTPKPDTKKDSTPKPDDKRKEDDKKESKIATPKIEPIKEEAKDTKDVKKDLSKDKTPKIEFKKDDFNQKKESNQKNEIKKEDSIEKKVVIPGREESKKDLKENDKSHNNPKTQENLEKSKTENNDLDMNKLNNSSDNLNEKSNASIKRNEKGSDSLLNISKSDDEDKYGQNKSKLDNSSLYNKKNYSRIEIDADMQKQDIENKKKIFMTEHQLNFDNKELFTFHDLIVPAGKNAKLCIVNEPYNKGLRTTEIADHFKFIEPTGVIMMIGANTKNKGKLFAGISRAAYNTKAIIVDSGLQTGIEKFCIRRNIPLVGVAPESKIEYPKPNPEKFSNKMLTNGHSHFILLGNDVNRYNWGEEARFKFQLAERLINGRKGFPYKGKGVGVILGNIPNCIEEIFYCIDKNWPLILIEDSDLTTKIIEIREGVKNGLDGNIKKIAEYSKLIEIDDDSENLASAIHLCLTVSF